MKPFERALHDLFTGLPHFDSAKLLRNRMGLTEQRLLAASAHDPRIRPDVERFVRLDGPYRAFLVRSYPFELIVRSLERPTDERNDESRQVFESVVEKLSAVSHDPEHMVHTCIHSGFDLEHVLTSPFPLTVSAVCPDAKNWEAALLQHSFDSQFSARMGISATKVLPFSPEHLQMLHGALHYLRRVYGPVVDQVTMNVRQFGYFSFANAAESEKHSIAMAFTYRSAPGVSFFSHKAFTSPYQLAETVFHESLHNKWAVMCMLDRIFVPEYDGTSGEEFVSPWAQYEADRLWPYDRAIAAYHVYVHLYAYYGYHIENLELEAERHEYIDEKLKAIRYKMAVIGAWLESQNEKVLAESGQRVFNKMKEIYEGVQ